MIPVKKFPTRPDAVTPAAPAGPPMGQPPTPMAGPGIGPPAAPMGPPMPTAPPMPPPEPMLDRTTRRRLINAQEQRQANIEKAKGKQPSKKQGGGIPYHHEQKGM